MSVFTTQGYRFRLVAGSGSYADKTILDTFADEQIKVSNNITELFDIGAVPGTFTRTITLPGTKRNNAFFQQYYDISVDEPDLFSTNQKIEAYLDFDGIYLVNGYMQLTKVSVFENKFVDSYEVNIFGIVSNFSTDAKRYFLTDLTNLNKFNHTSSIDNISSSWDGGLFSGSVRYALTDSGTNIYYSLTQDFLGIDDSDGALSVQNFKPALKLKDVWDGIFEKLGYTYTSSFWEQPWLDNVYLILNNNLKYPVYPTSIEKYGQAKMSVASGSYQNVLLTAGATSSLAFSAKEYDYNNVIALGNPTVFTPIKNSYYANRISLNFRVTNTGGGSGAPAFTIFYKSTSTGTYYSKPLSNINTYFLKLYQSRTSTVTETFTLPMDFQSPFLPVDSYEMYIGYSVQGSSNFTVTLNPVDSTVNTSLTITETKQAADGNILDIASNMPYGSNGILLIDFIRGVQKKFNLAIYEDKTTPNQFKVETFNTWYKEGEYKNFNQYINLNEKIEFIPASTLAVNKLNFTDTLDNDYVSTIWNRTYNRTYGQAILLDTGSYYSQGAFDIQSTLASGPLTSVPGAIVTGSYTNTSCTTYEFDFYGEKGGGSVRYTACDGTPVTRSLNNTVGPSSIVVCAQTNQYSLIGYVSATDLGDCSSTAALTGSQYPMYIPYYITNDVKSPAARVMPRLMFYNGKLPATPYWIEGYNPVTSSGSATAVQYNAYPYFDNYSVPSGSSVPTTGSYSLLYNNETAVLGTTPTGSLISNYWATYLGLLYNPRTRLVNAAAVIPLADYFDMELNDVVQFRSNYYHLRAINDYNLTTGECTVQLLGPVIRDAVSNVVFGTPTPNLPPEPPLTGSFNCDFNNDFNIYGCTP